MPVSNANIAYCKVVGQLVYTSLQANDADGKPNLEPFANKWVQFKPIPSKFTDLTHTPNALTVNTHFAPMRLYTNSDGIIIGDPNPSNLFGYIFAGNDPDTNPTGFDYEVTFEDNIFPKAFTPAPAGGTINIASVMNTVGNEGELTGPAELAAAAAASSAAAASASAASINRGGANGVAPLDASSRVPLINMPLDYNPGGGSGGSSTFAGLSDVSALAKTFVKNDLTTQAQMRDVIGAVTLGSSSTTAARGDLLATLTTRVDFVETTSSSLQDIVGDYSGTISGLSTDVASTVLTTTQLEARVAALETTVGGLLALLYKMPLLHFPVGNAFPARPNWPGRVWFMSSTITPLSNGVITGGGGMIQDWDSIIRSFDV